MTVIINFAPSREVSELESDPALQSQPLPLTGLILQRVWSWQKPEADFPYEAANTHPERDTACQRR